MRGRFAALTVLVALACNEVMGLNPGKLGGEEGEGESASGAPAEGGATSGTGNDSGRGGSSAGTGNASSGGAVASGGSGGAGGEGGVAPCSTTADCIEQGLAVPAHLCLAGACVDVLSEECDTVLGAEWLAEPSQDQPIVFGAVAENVDALSPLYLSLELSMKELAEHGPVPIDGIPQRPVLLVCSVSPDPFSTPTQRSLDHLIDLGVPGVVMIQSRSEIVASMEYAIGQRDADALFIDTGSGISELLGIRDGGRLWHMWGGAGDIIALFPPLIRRLEDHLNPGASSGPTTRLTKVVMIPPVEEVGFESAIARAADAGVYTNNRPMSAYPETYRVIAVRDRPDSAAMDTVSFAPDIVIDFAGIYPRLDAFTRQMHGVPPFYVLPPSQARSAMLLEAVVDEPSLRTRIIGVSHAGPDVEHRPLYDAYLDRFAAMAPGVDGSAGVSVYEAVYFLTYAAVAGGTGGFNMNRGMTRLLGLLTNSRRDIGPGSIDSVIELLGSEPSLRLHGALGPPGFDPYSGGRSMEPSAWCIDEDLNYAMDAFRLGPDERGRTSLVGASPCFDFREPG